MSFLRPISSSNTFGSFVFELSCRQTNKQSDRQNHAQTDADDRLTHATTVGVSNNSVCPFACPPQVVYCDETTKCIIRPTVIREGGNVVTLVCLFVFVAGWTHFHETLVIGRRVMHVPERRVNRLDLGLAWVSSHMYASKRWTIRATAVL